MDQHRPSGGSITRPEGSVILYIWFRPVSLCRHRDRAPSPVRRAALGLLVDLACFSLNGSFLTVCLNQIGIGRVMPSRTRWASPIEPTVLPAVIASATRYKQRKALVRTLHPSRAADGPVSLSSMLTKITPVRTEKLPQQGKGRWVHHAQPLVVPGEVFRFPADHLAKPRPHLGAVDCIVVSPVLISGVVRRSHVDALHLPGVVGQKRLQRRRLSPARSDCLILVHLPTATGLL